MEKIQSLESELQLLRERYANLADSHRHLHNQNSLLEDRILSLVEKFTDEKNRLEDQLINAKSEVFHLQENVQQLEVDKQRYKDDCNLAVRLLHQNPDEFNGTKSHLQERNDSSSHNLVLPTFPPTFVAALPQVNTPSSPQGLTDKLRLAESLFKSDGIHRYFVCRQCHRSVTVADATVQTSPDDFHRPSRLLSADEDVTEKEKFWTRIPGREYHTGHTKRVSQGTDFPQSSIPGMHHV